jgi:hypothetical protein
VAKQTRKYLYWGLSFVVEEVSGLEKEVLQLIEQVATTRHLDVHLLCIRYCVAPRAKYLKVFVTRFP